MFLHQYRINKTYSGLGLGWWLAWSCTLTAGIGSEFKVILEADEIKEKTEKNILQNKNQQYFYRREENTG
ncbi:MAG: hypothetical protein WC644_07645 [Ignavibacteria bacterium]